MLRFVVRLISVVLFMATLSCGSSKCLVRSDPPGAYVSVDREYRCNTPCEIELKKEKSSWWIVGGLVGVTAGELAAGDKKATIAVSKQGYVTEIAQVERKVKQLYFVLQPVLSDETQVPGPSQQQ
jgi:hypothetical protein